MSLARGHLPGTPARNGLPGRRNYPYRGTGKDTLTGHLTEYRIHHDITVHEGAEYTGYDSSLSPAPDGTGRRPGRQR